MIFILLAWCSTQLDPVWAVMIWIVLIAHGPYLGLLVMLESKRCNELNPFFTVSGIKHMLSEEVKGYRK